MEVGTMAIVCGHCNNTHETVAEVRKCAGALPYATVGAVGETTKVEARGENFFLTDTAQNLYDFSQEEMERNQRELEQDHAGYRAPVQAQKAPVVPNTYGAAQNTFLQVPYAEKDEAKALGARWNPQRKLWYVPAGGDLSKFGKWLEDNQAPAAPAAHQQSIARQAPKVIEEDGMYKMGNTIYKVQWNQTHTALYAKELKVQGEGHDAEVWFDYAPGAVRNLRPHHKMSLEEAKEFGALYGTCCVCGRTLTNEESIEAGIGPICGSKF